MLEFDDKVLTIAKEFCTSSVLYLILFALLICEDRISLQHQKCEIIQRFKQLLYHVRRMLEFDDKVLTIIKGFCTSLVLYLILFSNTFNEELLVLFEFQVQNLCVEYKI